MSQAISIVIVARNEEKHIGECLDSVMNQDFPKSNYEIICVDGGSTDKTAAICARYPVKLVSTGSGISHQRNEGIKAASAKYVAFIDADCIADREWLKKLFDEIEKSPDDVAAVGGPNQLINTDPPLSLDIGYAQETFMGSGGSPQCYRINRTCRVKSIPNCNIIYKKDIIAAEKYNENLSVGDDCELNFRLSRRGYGFLFLGDAVVWHHRPASFKSFVDKMFAYGEALGRITRMHRRVVRWYAPLAAVAIVGLLLSFPIIQHFPGAVYLYGLVAAGYLAGLCFAAFQVLRQYRTRRFPMTFILLPVQHFAYGLGFIKGFFI